MALRPIAAAVPAVLSLSLAGLLAACASEEPKTLEQWSGRHFYPQEFCLSIYSGQYERTPEYWRIRRWCDKREMQSDMFL